MAEESTGWGGVFKDFVGGAADSILDYGLPSWLDYGGNNAYGGNQQGAGRYPPVDNVGYDPYLVAANGQRPPAGMSQTTVLMIAGAVALVGVIVLVSD